MNAASIEDRKAIYRDLQEYIMDQALVLPAYEWTITHAMQDYVMGFRGDLLSRPYMNDVWIKKQ